MKIRSYTIDKLQYSELKKLASIEGKSVSKYVSNILQDTLRQKETQGEKKKSSGLSPVSPIKFQ